MAQAGELEEVLGRVLIALDPDRDPRRRTAGQLLRDVCEALPTNLLSEWMQPLDFIARAIKRRNHSVHSSVVVGSVWRDYATGDGGEWIPVVTTMNGEDYDGNDLRGDLALQQEATITAANLLEHLQVGITG